MKNSNYEVIGIASGKGGVGKTTVSVNLALAIARQKKKVVLIDADLGLANAQISLGINSTYNISDVVSGRKTVDEVAAHINDNLILIPGASGNSEMANLNAIQAQSLIQSVFDTFENLDIVFIDMAAGLAHSGLTFLRACDLKVVIIQDEPASLADAYGLIKIQQKENTMDDVLLLPNRVRNEAEGKHLFDKLNGICMRFLEQPVSYIHSIEEDRTITEATRLRKDLFTSYPSSRAAENFTGLALRLLEIIAGKRI